MTKRMAVLAAFFIAGSAHAQSFDGAWSGQAGQWSLSLTVSGQKGRLTMACAGADGFNDVSVAPDGSVNGTVKTGSISRQITGKLPSLNVPPGGSCGGGTATMVKK